jgi:hypothetical protein
LLNAVRSGSQQARERLRQASTRRISSPSLADAQLVVAREYGFRSWPKLKAHVEALNEVEDRVTWLREAFAQADQPTRDRLLSCVHTRERFQDYAPDTTELSERDARLVVANEAGYPFWRGYAAYLHLDPAVQRVLVAARGGELGRLLALLRNNPGAANPRWVRGWVADRVPMEAVPLNAVALGKFEGTNRRGNEYQLTRALIRQVRTLSSIMADRSRPQ